METRDYCRDVIASTSISAQSPTVLKSESGPIDTTTQTEDVVFKDDAHQRMTVPVRLSGAGPFRFMVDTGADRTAISRQLAARLKLVGGTSASLHSVAGVSTVETALVPELQLSRKSVKVIDAPLLDSEHMGADGILGVDSLRSQRIQFDFETEFDVDRPVGLDRSITRPTRSSLPPAAATAG